MKTLVTIGVPTYRNENTIEETLKSLLRQTYQEWVCIIADDSENEDCITKVRELVGLDNRFTVIKNSNRLGAAGNWNLLLSMCETEYFKLLCGDDTLSPSALEAEIEALESNSNAAMSCGRRDIVNSKGRVIMRDRGFKKSASMLSGSYAINRFIITGTNFFGEPSFVMFRSHLLKKEGGFNKDWKYLIDVESYISVLSHGDLAVLDTNLGAFRISNQSWSANLTKSQRSETFNAIDYAKSKCPEKVSPWEVVMGKTRATINTFIRRLVFRFSA